MDGVRYGNFVRHVNNLMKEEGYSSEDYELFPSNSDMVLLCNGMYGRIINTHKGYPLTRSKELVKALLANEIPKNGEKIYLSKDHKKDTQVQYAIKTLLGGKDLCLSYITNDNGTITVLSYMEAKYLGFELDDNVPRFKLSLGPQMQLNAVEINGKTTKVANKKHLFAYR